MSWYQKGKPKPNGNHKLFWFNIVHSAKTEFIVNTCELFCECINCLLKPFVFSDLLVFVSGMLICDDGFVFQLNLWFEELKQELKSSEIAETIADCEAMITQFGQQRDATIDAFVSTISEGESLLQQLRCAADMGYDHPVITYSVI